MEWKFTDDAPIYLQIMNIMKQQIASGELTPGQKLSSVREMALEAGVNPNTMQKALSELERSGLVMAQRTSGRVVTEDMDMIGEVRNNLAREQVHEFFVRMQELGYNRQEIMHLLEKEGEHE